MSHGEEAVGMALSKLNAAQRQVLVLRALGHDGPSIGRLLGITAGTARKRLMVARAAFMAAYAHLNAADGTACAPVIQAQPPSTNETMRHRAGLKQKIIKPF